MPAGWDATRARILRRDPWCQIAGPGCAGRSTEVDHRRRGGGEDDTNLRGVCHPCHKAKTQREAASGHRER